MGTKRAAIGLVTDTTADIARRSAEMGLETESLDDLIRRTAQAGLVCDDGLAAAPADGESRTGHTARTAAARMRAYRARVRAGKVIVSVPIDDVLVPQALVDANLLAQSQIDDREAIAAALGRLIARVCSDSGDA
jgi:hypothetical protein